MTLAAVVVLVHGAMDTSQRQFKVVNQSGEKVSVEWVNPNDGHRVPLGAPTSGESVDINSFVNHTFVIRRSKDKTDDNDDETDENCTEEFYRVTDDEVQILVVKDGLVVEQKTVHELKEAAISSRPKQTEPQEEESVDISSECRKEAEKALNEKRIPQSVIFDRLTECLTRHAAEVIVEKSDELVLEASLRVEMSRLAENYTCADRSKEASPPIATKTWTHEGVERQVNILHERRGSQIHMLFDFISEEECRAVQEAAAPSLHRGTVADGKGGSRMSDNRKAWQAGLKVDWQDQKDPIAAVKRRLFDYANHATGYNMTLPGQEDLMSIQYFGNGLDDPTPDRYTPHCDGQCDGLPFKHGGRVATMVMYCDVPEVGGGTNFQNAGVFVKPKVRVVFCLLC